MLDHINLWELFLYYQMLTLEFLLLVVPYCFEGCHVSGPAGVVNNNAIAMGTEKASESESVKTCQLQLWGRGCPQAWVETGRGGRWGQKPKGGEGETLGEIDIHEEKKSINQITLSLMCKIVMTFSQYGFSHVCAGRRFVPYWEGRQFCSALI